MIDFMHPIPNAEFPTNKEVVNATQESLVAIPFGVQFINFPAYFRQGIPCATEKPMLRKSVLERLKKAASLLPQGYRLVVLDAWRPYAVQKGLYDTYYQQLQKDNPTWTQEQLNEQVKFFVSPPSTDALYPAVHSTGGAVDVTIADVNGKWLDMGTDFDDFSPLAHTAAFEGSDNETVQNNRRLLFHCMIAAGFTNLPSEWWHYDYGNGFWAHYNQCTPLYDGILE